MFLYGDISYVIYSGLSLDLYAGKVVELWMYFMHSKVIIDIKFLYSLESLYCPQ